MEERIKKKKKEEEENRKAKIEVNGLFKSRCPNLGRWFKGGARWTFRTGWKCWEA